MRTSRTIPTSNNGTGGRCYRSVLWLLTVGLLVSTAQSTFAERFTFETKDQALFGLTAGEDGVSQVASKRLAIDVPLMSAGLDGIKEGRIERLPAGVPVETLQQGWDFALAECTKTRSFNRTFTLTLPPPADSLGRVSRSCAATVTPTRAQCESGGNITPNVTGTCCVGSGGSAPNNCPSVLFLPKTINTPIPIPPINVGTGIGPRPTEGTERDYDIGVIVEGSGSIEIGVEGYFELDGGSVDVEYSTEVSFTSNADEVALGELITFSLSHSPDAEGVQMTSRYPTVETGVNLYNKADLAIDAKFAMADFVNGSQLGGDERLWEFSSAAHPDADDDGRIRNPLLQVEVGLGSGDLIARTNADMALRGLLGGEIDPEEFRLPLRFDAAITAPPTLPFCEEVPRPDCVVQAPATTDLTEFTWQVPTLNTPAHDDFNGGVLDQFNPNSPPFPQSRNELLFDGSLYNSTLTGGRDALQSSLEALGTGRLSDLNLEDGILDTDFQVVAIDADGYMPLPVGANITLINPLRYLGRLLPFPLNQPLLTAEVNAVDADVLGYFSLDQQLTFTPNLRATITFDANVVIDFPEGVVPLRNEVIDGRRVVEFDVPKGAPTKFFVEQREGGVTATPAYSVRGNTFRNQLDLLVNAGVKGTIAEVEVGGLIGSLSPLKHIALLTLAPEFDEPIRIPGEDLFSLGGFGDDQVGTPLVIAEGAAVTIPEDGDGDGVIDLPIDTDGDGLFDLIERILGLNPIIPGGALHDTDGDGFANLAEQLLGTNPGDATDFPRLDNLLPGLAAAVLPGHRTSAPNRPVTAFATLINTGTEIAKSCGIAPSTPLASNFSFTPTDPATNQINGLRNQRVNIEPGAEATFIFEFVPLEALGENVDLIFDCANTAPAPIFENLNTFGLNSVGELAADIVAIARTISADGQMIIEEVGGSAAFVVATSNVGNSDVVTARVRASLDDLPVNLSLCESDPATAACLSDLNAETVLPIDAAGIPTFSVFATATAAIANDPARHRVVVEFLDAADRVVGSTSVSIATLIQ